MELVNSSMLTRSASKTLSTNRFVQLAVFLRLSSTEKTELFNLVVKALSFDFPYSWEKQALELPRSVLDACNAIWPHVHHLMWLSQNHTIESCDNQLGLKLVC